jgi:hypothetical protein
MNKVSAITLAMVVLFAACRTRSTEQILELDSNFTESDTIVLKIPDTNSLGAPIFSNMNLSVSLSDFFARSGGHYKSELLHSLAKAETYLSSQARALNLGMYAVDFNYTRTYEQLQESEHYLNVILNLGSKLGIPNDFIEISIERLDKSIADADSFALIANEIYVKTKSYFTDNENENNVLLILIGGLTEVFYIASQMPITETGALFTYDLLYEQKLAFEGVIKYCELVANNDIFEDVLPLLEEVSNSLVNTEGMNKKERLKVFEQSQQSIAKLRTFVIETP